MRKALLLALLVLPATALADKDFMGADDGVTHDCATDDKVNINYDGGKFTFTGECAEINLNGKAVKITATDIGKININGEKNSVSTNTLGSATINGVGNKVTYKKPKTGKKAGATILGKGNSVTKVK